MSTPSTPQNPSHTLLHRAHSPTTASRIYHEKIRTKPLLLHPTDTTDPSDARTQRQRARARKTALLRRKNPKPKPLSAKQKRALCVYEIPKEQRRYAIYVPLYRVWCGYMREVLGLGRVGAGREPGWMKQGQQQQQQEQGEGVGYVTAQSAGPLLVSADFHGAEVEVVRSRCVSRVGVRGIVVKDTKFTFEIVTRGDEAKTIPKEHTIFRFEVPPAAGPADSTSNAASAERPRNLVFELHGSQFRNRAPDRANKKFKLHISPDL